MALTDAAPEPERPHRSVAQKVLPYTTAALVIAILYVAWTFYSRYESNRKAEADAAAKEQEARKRVVDTIYGSGEIKFSTFAADSGVVHPGQTVHLCYGVVNAQTVSINPPVGEQLKPTYYHCLDVQPKKTTTYTITAKNAKGDTKSQSLTIEVR
jgi:hypothetical protein